MLGQYLARTSSETGLVHILMTLGTKGDQIVLEIAS